MSDGNIGCSGTQITVDVWVEPTPKVDLSYSKDTICNDDRINIQLTSPTQSTQQVRFRYSVENPGSVSVVSGSTSNLTPGFIISDSLHNFSDTAQFIRFIVTPYTIKAGSGAEKCTGLTEQDTALIWLEPTAKVTLTPVNDTICTNLFDSVHIQSPTIPTRDIRFRYEAIPDNPGDIVVYYSADTFDYQKDDNIIDSVVNLSTVPQRVEVEVTPYLLSGDGNPKCPGIISTAVIYVAPKLQLTLDIDTLINGLAIACNDSSATVRLIPYGGILAFNGYDSTDVNYFVNSNPVPNNIVTYPEGEYYVKVNDQLQCVIEDTLILEDPGMLHSNVELVNSINCLGDTTTAYVIVSDGNVGRGLNYTTKWIEISGWLAGDLPVFGDSIHGFKIPSSGGAVVYSVLDELECPSDQNSKTFNAVDVDISWFKVNDTTDGGYHEPCYGDALAELELEMSSPGPTYTYYIKDINKDTLFTGSWNGVPLPFNNMPAGPYFVEVRDTNNCPGFDSTVITQPDSLALESYQLSLYHGDNFNVSCYGAKDGSIDVEFTGGRPNNYNYEWSAITDGEITSPYAEDQDNIPFGEYQVVVNDNYCYDTVEFTLVPPDELIVADKDTTNVACYGEATGSIIITPQGIGNEFSYDWSHNPSLHTNQAAGLAAGTYYVEITDSLGCAISDTTLLTQPNAILVDIITDTAGKHGFEITCDGDSDGHVSAVVSGGVGGYDYSWTDERSVEVSTDSFATGLIESNYELEITDDNGCRLTTNFELTAPPALQTNMVITDVICATLGTATVEVTGGVKINGSAYNYQWSPLSATTATINDLDTGMYIVTVTDWNNCTINDTALIEEAAPLAIDLILTQEILCYNDNTARIEAQITNGKPPYDFTWSTGSHASVLINAGPGQYSVDVEDDNGCKGIDSMEITEPDEILLLPEVMNANCYDSADAVVYLDATGGTGDFQFLWDGNIWDDTVVDHLHSRSYTMTVIDENGCRKDTLLILTQPAKLTIQSEQINSSCPDAPDGSIEVSVEGGVMPYTYEWIDQDNSTTRIEEITKGVYTFTVTDANNCIQSAIITINSELPACIDVPTAFSPNSDMYNDLWELTNPINYDLEIETMYPGLVVKVFNRWGKEVWTSAPGYPLSGEWNGEDNNGRPLPVDSYYYIIYLNDGSGITMKGVVTIVK